MEQDFLQNLKLLIGSSSVLTVKCGKDIFIGINVMMGTEGVISIQNHSCGRLDILMGKQGYTSIEPVIIGNIVWIGRRIMIMPDVHIGDSGIIGARAVAAKILF